MKDMKNLRDVIFDPLAIMLLIAANWSIVNPPKKKLGRRRKPRNPFQSKSSMVSVDKKSIFEIDEQRVKGKRTGKGRVRGIKRDQG